MNKVGFFRSIQLKFIVIYILLLLVAIQVIGSYVSRELETKLIDTFQESVNDRVDLLTYNLTQVFNEEDENGQNSTIEKEIQNILADIDTGTITNLQVVNNQSRVIGTSDYLNQDVIGEKATSEIIQKALLLGSSVENTFFNARTESRVYVRANPIYDSKDDVVGIIYIEASLEYIYDQLQNINQIFLRGSILAITISAILGVLVARTITRPILEMRRQAQLMARGDFSQTVNVYGTDEISHLAETFNDLNSRLKRSMATIEKEQQKLSSVLANMSEGVISTDKDGKITLINEAAARIFGMNPTKLMGDYLLDYIELDEPKVDISHLAHHGSMIIDMSSEDIFLVQINFSTVYDENDEITSFIIVLNDVTEQEKMEQERRQFVSNVSHELRTPLTTMRSYLEALTDGAWQDKEIAPKFLSVTQNETERMIRLVNDLLQLSRMDSKEQTVHRKRIDFISYFHHIIDRFEMNTTHEIALKRQLPHGKFFVWLDEDKMTQVLDNIISNAIKYSPEGGTIRFKVEKIINQNRELLISIQDQGLGIPYDKLDKIFDRFYRSDRARARKLGGSGLGLAISKELVEAHNGSIWAESIEGKGTTILFTLPLMNKKRGRRR